MQATGCHFSFHDHMHQIWTTYYPSSGAMAVLVAPGRGEPDAEAYVVSVNMDHGQDHESKDLPEKCFYVPTYKPELGEILDALLQTGFCIVRSDLPQSHSGYVTCPAWELVV